METGSASDSCAFNMLLTKSVPHILEMIFLSLDYESFKKCLEVSVTWQKILTSESFQVMGKLVFHDETPKDELKLLESIKQGNVKEVKRLMLSGLLDLNFLSYDSTPLHEAIRNGRKQLVPFLLERGAEPNKANKLGYTSLHIATIYHHKDVVQLLLDRGALLNQRNVFGQTPLHHAALCGLKEVALLLLSNGADPSIPDKFGLTATCAAKKGRWANRDDKKEVLRLLAKQLRRQECRRSSEVGNISKYARKSRL